MPELPEVETVCQALKPVLEGQAFTKIQCNRQNLRYPLPLNMEGTLKDNTITLVVRRAKYLLLHFNHGLTLIWHLGMSGRVLIEEPGTSSVEAGKHDHVIFITTQKFKITFNDPRRFGFLLIRATDQIENSTPFNSLGFEPLSDCSLNTGKLYASLRRRAIPIKNALLNQNIIAGIGNIYASEALWQARISPLRLANTLNLEETNLLLNEIQDVLRRAIAAGGSTLRDHIQPNGNIGYFQHSFKVYNRANMPCHHCQTTLLTKMNQSGRATYYCEKCQQ